MIKTELKYCLGTAIKITTMLENIATADSAKITIENPSGVNVVDSADMTQESDYVYYYIYQTNEDDPEGTYIITIDITQGSYTSRKQITFDTYQPNID